MFPDSLSPKLHLGNEVQVHSCSLSSPDPSSSFGSLPWDWTWAREGFRVLSQTEPHIIFLAILVISNSLKAGKLTLIDYECSPIYY